MSREFTVRCTPYRHEAPYEGEHEFIIDDWGEGSMVRVTCRRWSAGSARHVLAESTCETMNDEDAESIALAILAIVNSRKQYSIIKEEKKEPPK